MGGKVTREWSIRLHAVGFAKAAAASAAVVPGAPTPPMAGGASHKESVPPGPNPYGKELNEQVAGRWHVSIPATQLVLS
jgi:hypothetical protein